MTVELCADPWLNEINERRVGEHEVTDSQECIQSAVLVYLKSCVAL